MADEIRRTRQLIGDPEGLQFELRFADADRRGLAEGEGRVFLGGQGVWFGEGPDGEEAPFSWTWVDLLAFLGRWWPWLILEEDYPLPVQPLYPAFFLQEAEKRWHDLPERQVEEEEEAAHRFVARHDLAEAFKGLFLPSLMLLRQGERCMVSAAALRQTRIRPWQEVRATLESLGDCLARQVQDSENPRAQQALEWWRERDARAAERELDIVTGLSAPARERIEQAGLAAEQWAYPEVRAVARMSRGAVLEEQRKALLLRVAAVPACSTPELDRIAAAIREEFSERGEPYEQGYWAAARLRRELGISAAQPLDPEDWLRRWGVAIETIALPGCPVDAVTAWGEHHGPVVILNCAEGSRAAHTHGKRATLAHEIAHLILDRHEGALPAGEVLGGRVPEYPEKRARAFAAEFLLPREAVAEEVRRHPSLPEAAHALQERHRVSAELLAWQINNSEAWVTLGENERTLIEQWKSGRVEVGASGGA
ncbi:ImmA/IrrE family metallo-endopeptidase [Alkalilimnicola ehrlichii]|uniref:ImmA/IrrE family metallo-endopeptidase n=1 Tax=Alkalilimnicola ehrlichii TaxID=351052 RepID=UPI003BA18210